VSGGIAGASRELLPGKLGGGGVVGTVPVIVSGGISTVVGTVPVIVSSGNATAPGAVPAIVSSGSTTVDGGRPDDTSGVAGVTGVAGLGRREGSDDETSPPIADVACSGAAVWRKRGMPPGARLVSGVATDTGGAPASRRRRRRRVVRIGATPFPMWAGLRQPHR
jgi:hypothetical protein